MALLFTNHILRELGQSATIEDALCPSSCVALRLCESFPRCFGSLRGVPVACPKLQESFLLHLLPGKGCQASLPIWIAHLDVVLTMRNFLATRELTPHHIEVAESNVFWRIHTRRWIVFLLLLEHGHQGNDAPVLLIVTERADIVQPMSWCVQAVALLHRCVHPLGVCELGPSLQVHPLTIYWRVIGTSGLSFVGAEVLIPHWNDLGVCI
mmetsp:Transcript_41548/g.75300  ORF Transcript_41548/g.75300 Transcript_41548/m.75300 type:complete len:210 (-) Transcript_41548:849-1478(-)